MKKKFMETMGFILFMVGPSGKDGEHGMRCTMLFLLGLIILWKESKKIDAQPASRNVY